MKIYYVTDPDNPSRGGFVESETELSEGILVTPEERISLIEDSHAGKGFIEKKDGKVQLTRFTVSIDDLKFRKIAEIKTKAEKYIFGKFPQGTQNSLMCLAMSDSTKTDTKNEIKSVWTWIKNVLSYVYECEDTISELTSADEITKYDVYFTKFDRTVPTIKLRKLIE